MLATLCDPRRGLTPSQYAALSERSWDDEQRLVAALAEPPFGVRATYLGPCIASPSSSIVPATGISWRWRHWLINSKHVELTADEWAVVAQLWADGHPFDPALARIAQWTPPAWGVHDSMRPVRRDVYVGVVPSEGRNVAVPFAIEAIDGRLWARWVVIPMWELLRR